MHITLTSADGDRDVRLIDLYALRRGSVVAETLDLLADLEDARKDADEELSKLREERERGKVTDTRLGARGASLAARLEQRAVGIWGHLLLQLLHDCPPAPQGDLLPYERGFGVVEGLLLIGWTLEDVNAAATAILHDGPAANAEAREAAQVKARVQRGMDFSSPQQES